MKKLLLLIALIFSLNVSAGEIIQVVWPFALGNNQGNHIRTLVENANKVQEKYTFVFINKQGAGGTVAVNTVLNSNKTTILAMSSSFYLTPLITKDSYNVDKFLMLSLMCVDRPLAIYSKKLNSLDTDNIIFVGGAVGMQALVPKLLLQAVPSMKITQVPFKTGPDASLAMIGGHIDASVDFLGAYSTIVSPGSGVKVLGVTGQRNVINKVPTIPGTEHLVGDLLLFVPSNIDTVLHRELYHIFNSSQDENTDMYCKNDYGKPVKAEFENLSKINELNKSKWKKMTAGIKPE
jgi:tripartite-type tricarboxylate transporter receptor subunit TctC